MKPLFKIALLCLICIMMTEKSYAFPPPTAKPLPLILLQSDVIVLARINNYQPDNVLDKAQNQQKTPTEQFIAQTAIKSPGIYTFTAIRKIKGDVPNNFTVHIPIVSSAFYNDSEPKFDRDCFVLLFLHLETENGFVVTDEHLPFIPLSKAVLSLDNTRYKDVEDAVVDAMLATFDDPVLLRANLYLLRPVVNQRIPKIVSRYEHDPNLNVRNDALYCLIANQQVQAIPLMAELSTELLKANGGGASVGVFENLKTKDAVPYLNPLLEDASIFTRQSASFALRRLADRTSIPYLIQGLKMPDPQHITRYEIYVTLHRLIHTLGQTKDLPVFATNEDTELQPIYSWWEEHKRSIIKMRLN